MADSVRERILGAMETVLTAAGVAASPTFAVERWKQTGPSFNAISETTGSGLVVIVPRDTEYEDQPNPQVTAKMVVDLDLYASDLSPAPGSDPTDRKLNNNLWQPVMQAVLANRDWGGDADDTDLLRDVGFETDDAQPHAGIIITIEVQYKFLNTDVTVFV